MKHELLDLTVWGYPTWFVAVNERRSIAKSQEISLTSHFINRIMKEARETIFLKYTEKCVYDDKLGYLPLDESRRYRYEQEDIEYFDRVDKYSAVRISPFRNGLAIYLDKSYSCGVTKQHTFLVNEDRQIIFHKFDDELYDYVGPIIKRVFGGFYIVYTAKHGNYRTFPGQDRETEYTISPEVDTIILEDGTVLNPIDSKTFLLWHKITEYEEVSDSIVKVGFNQFRLSDFTLINELPY